MGRVGTLIIKCDNQTLLEESIEAANAASHEHPSRVIAVTGVDPGFRRHPAGRPGPGRR